MKKKGIIKDSQYYYKKADFKKTFKTVLISGTCAIISMVGFLAYKTIQYRVKLDDYKETSGYVEYIQDDIERLKTEKESGEITTNVYNAEMEDLNSHENFKAYLKDNNHYLLPEFEKFEKFSLRNGTYVLIIGGAAASGFLIPSISSIVLRNHYDKKAQKIKEKEDADYIEVSF